MKATQPIVSELARQRVLPIFLLSLLLLLLAAGRAAAQVPTLIDYPGRLLDGTGVGVTDPAVAMTFSLYTAPTGGTVIWQESQTVTVEAGRYAVLLGTVVPLTPAAIDPGGPVWLEVAVSGLPLAPRRTFNVAAVPWAFQAANADTVGGKSAIDLDQAAHVARTDNPHGVTPAQIGAASGAGMDSAVAAHAAVAAAHHAKTTSFTELTGQIGDSQIPATLMRDVERTWPNLANIPAGFADNVDNVGPLGGPETDPQVGANTTGFVPRWGGAALTSGGLYDDGAGHVAIGTTAPSRPFEVHGTQSGYGMVRIARNEAGDHEAGLAFVEGSDAPGSDFWVMGVGGWGNTNDFFLGRGAVRLLIEPTGNVGIGTSSPAARLDVVASARVTGGEPTLILHDTGRDGTRPTLRVEGNGVAALEGDDASDHYFGLYTTFTSSRLHSAALRLHGSTATKGGSWGTVLSLSHDGSDGRITTDVGDIRLEPGGGPRGFPPQFQRRLALTGDLRLAALAYGDGTRQHTPLHDCWDLDSDGVTDAAEDVNGDGQWNAHDCTGQPGRQGPWGIDGPAGPAGAQGPPCWSVLGDRNGDGVADINDCEGPQGYQGVPSCWQAAGTEPATGDRSGDGVVTALDCQYGPPGTNGEVCTPSRDLNGDGRLDVRDCVALLP